MTGLPPSRTLRPPTAPDPAGAALRAKSVCCPRCGYDQRGEIETWRDRCPVESICSECGFTLPWYEILGTRKPLPRWSFEQGPLQRLPRTTFASVVMAHRPGHYWRSIKPWHEVRFSRLAAFILVTALAAWIVFTVGQATISALSVPPAAAAGATGLSALDVFLRVAINPLSEAPPATYTFPTFQSAIYWLTPPRILAQQYWAGPSLLAGWLLLVQVFCSLGFAALPQSRRKAKVRWAHIARIAVHGMAFPFTLWTIFALQIASLSIFGISGFLASAVANMPLGLYLIALLPLLLAWWSFATGRYLCMDHSWGVGTAVLAMGLLASTVLLFTLLPFHQLQAVLDVLGP